ncbi:tetratricopeptide repeat protein [Deinococcus maricopensis]|uniref:Uncharacterized protein n=1 Tax=Deinococcus maricopensis (strain DSM 21211 / LMG 22137 / NRRL B-23946 / LB-34) TaxID=709986 RepID=E8U5A4_DEIML|nr:tetratricopeptide repeat protein [Deinococcus maricopensis]ADV66243.1 hypothetical protein Deima_0584 [Deinococcus maricopensis DSM 21211]
MVLLPARVRARLAVRPTVVVAPVGVGFAQDALLQWATAHGYTVTRDLTGDETGLTVWWPRSRGALETLGNHADPRAALLLEEADLTYHLEDWANALPGLSADKAADSHAQAEGWPAALPLAAALADHPATDLAAHPLAPALLGPLLPPMPLRSAFERLAPAPLVTPDVARLLGTSADDVRALVDGGWLTPIPGGWRAPTLLRHLAAPAATARTAERIARALHDAGHTDAALGALAHAGAWRAYLRLLAAHARAQDGEAALRARLRPLPPAWAQHPDRLYLAGLLARASGDLDGADALYRAARRGARAGLRPTLLNAHGVVLALLDRADEALLAFEQAERGALGVVAGEAAHNRAGLLTRLGRHADAEASLRAAVGAFRAAGDATREARSLEVLGTLLTARGLLREALTPYEGALRLLDAQGAHASAALARVNLAEVHALLGDPGAAEQHLERADTPAGRDTHGWAERGRALVALLRDDHDDAARRLAALRAAAPADRALRAEVALLLARTHRERGDEAAARAALADARPLGWRARLEAALLGDGDLTAAIQEARAADARHELALALLHRADGDDLHEALALIRTHGYATLLGGPLATRLAGIAHTDTALRALFPISVALLGPLTVRFAGQTLRLADFPTRKSAALLVALAVADHPQPREALADRFWPDAKNPLASLQTAVYHLRSALGAPVVQGERGVLALSFPARVDTRHLEDAVARADLTALLTALPRGPEVPAVLPDLPADLAREREHAERTLTDAYRLLAAHSPASSDARRDALRALIAGDPYDLDAREQLAALHDARGEREAAAQERARLHAARHELRTR